MFITVTGLKYITGAQMMVWQGSGGFFIGPDTLVYEAQLGDEETAEMAATLPVGTVRKSKPEEVLLWEQRQISLMEAAERRWETRTKEDPADQRARQLAAYANNGAAVAATAKSIAAPTQVTRPIPNGTKVITADGLAGEIKQFKLTRDTNEPYYEVFMSDGTTGRYLAEEFEVVN